MDIATQPTLDNTDGNSQLPPLKRVKVEHDTEGESRLLLPAGKREKKRGRRNKLTKTTTQERALILLQDERIDAVEPSQVMCKMCGNWVQLFKHTDFSPANWRVHAEKCEARTGWSTRPRSPLTIRIPARPNLNTNANSHSTPNSVNSISAVASTLDSTKTMELPSESVSVPAVIPKPYFVEHLVPGTSRLTVNPREDRKRQLESDSRVEICEPHRILCKRCKSWVYSHPAREYDVSSWTQHTEKCDVDQARSLTKDTSDEPGDETMVDADPELTLKDSENRVNGPQKGPIIHVLDDDDEVEEVGSGEASKRSVTSTSAPPVKSESVEDPEVLFAAFQAEGENIYTGRRRKGRTAEERRRVLESDHRAGQVNPHDVYCKMCNKWIKLYREIPYVESNWTRHAERCEVRQAAKMRRQPGMRAPTVSAPTAAPTATTSSSKRAIPTPLSSIKQTENTVQASVSAPIASSSAPIISKDPPVEPQVIVLDESVSTGRAPIKENKGVEARKAILEADENIRTVEAHQVRCKLCNNWIRLQPYREYDAHNWGKHISHCRLKHPREPSGAMAVKMEEKEAGPSNFTRGSGIYPYPTAPRRVTLSKAKDDSTAEERRQVLIRDGRCESIEAHHVTCKNCGREIGLHTKKDYSLTNWFRHIRCCLKNTEKKYPSKAPIATPLSELGISRSAVIDSLTSPSTQTLPNDERTESAIDLTQDESDVNTVPLPPPKKSAEDRRKSLLADPRVEAVQPNCIQCKLCNRWLKLTDTTDYAPYNWYKHVERCEVRTAYKGSDTVVSPVASKEVNADGPSTAISAEETHAPGLGTSAPDVIMADVPVGPTEADREADDDLQSVDDPSSSAKWSAKKRHSTEERLARLQADKRIKTIEKHRAQCGICDKWVKLQNKTEYDPHNWFAHIKKCEIKAKVPSVSAPLPVTQPIVQPSAQLSAQPSTQPSNIPTPMEESPSVNDSDSISCTVGRTGNITVDRQVLLENDERISRVEPHRVLCGICQQWIKLREEKDYVPYNWFKHKSKCERKFGLPHLQTPIQEQSVEAEVKNEHEVVSAPVILPVAIKEKEVTISSMHRKISTEDREAELRADPRTASVEPGRVLCKICNSWIKLNTATGFLPGNWLRHATRCQRKNQWQGGPSTSLAGPIELSNAEVVDLEAEQVAGVVFGTIELVRIINSFEPTITSQDFGKAPEVKEVKHLKQEPSWTLRARTNTPIPVVVAPATVAPPAVEPIKVLEVTGKRMHRTEESRKEDLERDPRTKIVHSEKILCAMCDRWIQMRKDVSYSPQNWLKHAGICEARTGWPKNKPKPDAEPKVVQESASSISQPPTRASSEEPMPYNARIARDNAKKPMKINSESNSAPIRMKPVDWDQEVIYSEDDDDDDLSPGPIPVVVTAPPPATESQPTASGSSLQSPQKVEESAQSSHAGKGRGKKPINVTKPLNFLPTPFTHSPLPVWRHVVPATNGQRMVMPQMKPPVPYPYATPYGAGIAPVAGILPHLLPPTMTMYSHPHAHSLPSPFQKTTPPVPSSGIGKAVSPPASLPPTHSALPTPPPSTSAQPSVPMGCLPNGVLRLAPSPPLAHTGMEAQGTSDQTEGGSKDHTTSALPSSYPVPPLTKLNVPIMAPQPAPALGPLQASLSNSLATSNTYPSPDVDTTSSIPTMYSPDYKSVQFVPSNYVRKSPGPVGPVGPGVLQLAPSSLPPTSLRATSTSTPTSDPRASELAMTAQVLAGNADSASPMADMQQHYFASLPKSSTSASADLSISMELDLDSPVLDTPVTLGITD